MGIKSMRHFITGLITVLLAMVCFAVIISTEFQIRFLISGILLVAFTFYNLLLAFRSKPSEAAAVEPADERDRLLAMKSGYATLKIMNYALLLAAFVCTVLYGVTKAAPLLVIGLTLYSVLLVMFLVILGVNRYYEKRC